MSLCCRKDISDSECRTCKIAARNHEMKHTEKKPTRIRTAEELKIFCEGKLTLPQRTLKQKNGKGIYKRYFHYVPAAGALKTVEDIKAASGTAGSGPVNRRIRKGKTVKGSSKFTCSRMLVKQENLCVVSAAATSQNVIVGQDNTTDASRCHVIQSGWCKLVTLCCHNRAK